MSVQKPQEPSRKRQILSSEVQKHRGQSARPADLRPSHTEPGCILEGQVRGGTEVAPRAQGQGRCGVNGAELKLPHSISPSGPACSLRAGRQVKVNSSILLGKVCLIQRVRTPGRQLNGARRGATAPQQVGEGSTVPLPLTGGMLLLVTSGTVLHCSQPQFPSL